MKRALMAGMACLVVMIVSACGSSGGGAAAESHAALVTGGTLSQLIPSDPGNLDPLTTTNFVTKEIDFYAYDPLVNELPSGTLTSGLAKHWQGSGTKYTFVLNSGITCSDGSTFTASTAAANINFIANPKNAAPARGVQVPADAKATANNATSTVTVTLAKPAPFFLQNLGQVGMVCAKGLADPKTLSESSDGTGPFALTSAVAGQQYTLSVRHGYHWGPAGASTSAAGIPAKIDVKVVSSATTEANELADGQANIAQVVGLASKPLSAAGLFHQDITAPLGQLWFNQAPDHPGSSEMVRRALIEALKLSDIGAVYGQGEGQPSTGLMTFTPKVCPGNTVQGNLPAYGLAAARQLLNQAGWTMGSGGVRTKDGKQLSIQLLYDSDAGGDPSSAYQLAAQEWSKIGVKVKLVSDTSVALEGVVFGTSGNWDVTALPVGVYSPDQWVPLFDGPAPPSGDNFADIKNSSYDSLSATALAKAGSAGCPDWNRAEVALFKAVDFVPFENDLEPLWGKSVTFSSEYGNVFGTSLRLRKS